MTITLDDLARMAATDAAAWKAAAPLRRGRSAEADGAGAAIAADPAMQAAAMLRAPVATTPRDVPGWE